MPVHYSHAAGILVMAVDGDFTLAELDKVVESAAGDPSVPQPTRVLLDLSGAASLAHKSDGELAECAGLFAVRASHYERIAVLVAGDQVDDLLRMGTAFVAQDGLQATPFRSRADAEAWLKGEG